MKRWDSVYISTSIFDMFFQIIFKMNDNFKIASWNVCLGLANKKDVVSKMITENKIDICCLQETDIPVDYNHELLSFRGHTLIVEKNDVKSRLGMYIKDGINYTRRSELEGANNGLIVIDVKLKFNYRIIGVYRIFNPQAGITQRNYFSNQLNMIKQATDLAGRNKVVILGDFNLNEEMKYCPHYSHKAYFV